MKKFVFINPLLVSIIVAGCATQAELSARDNFLAAANKSSVAANLGDKKALADTCMYYHEAAKLAIKIADAEAALNACELSGNAGNAYSSYLMGYMLRTTNGFYRSTEYEHRYSTHLERNVATAQWFRKAERDGFKPAAEDALKMEVYIANSRDSSGSNTLGKVAVGLFVAGVASSANISSEARAKVVTSVASDLASGGTGTATARLLSEQSDKVNSSKNIRQGTTTNPSGIQIATGTSSGSPYTPPASTRKDSGQSVITPRQDASAHAPRLQRIVRSWGVQAFGKDVDEACRNAKAKQGASGSMPMGFVRVVKSEACECEKAQRHINGATMPASCKLALEVEVEVEGGTAGRQSGPSSNTSR